jgi:hypothetical protein
LGDPVKTKKLSRKGKEGKHEIKKLSKKRFEKTPLMTNVKIQSSNECQNPNQKKRMPQR